MCLIIVTQHAASQKQEVLHFSLNSLAIKQEIHRHHKETANAAISPGSKNHVTRKHNALQPKRLQIMDMMMMMAVPELNQH